MKFSDGSVATIHYLSNGHKSYPKERIEIFVSGKILQINNFRKMNAIGWKNFKNSRLWRQNKGQNECVAAFISAVKNGHPAPIAFNEVIEVTRITIELANHFNVEN